MSKEPKASPKRQQEIAKDVSLKLQAAGLKSNVWRGTHRKWFRIYVKDNGYLRIDGRGHIRFKWFYFTHLDLLETFGYPVRY